MRAVIPTLLCLAGTVLANDWHQFRGPNAGKLDQLAHPTEWNAKKNIAWAVPVEGSGWSSPVVVGDRIFLTSAVSKSGSKPKDMGGGVRSMGTYRMTKPEQQTYVVHCLSLENGKPLWSRVVD